MSTTMRDAAKAALSPPPIREAENTVAAGVATLKKSIQMKDFRDDDSIARCVSEQVSIALGQVAGYAVTVKLREGTLPNGDKNQSYVTIGDFEAVNYKTGKEFSSTAVYLPRYFAETLEAALAKSPNGIAFGIEIIVEPTGKKLGQGIQYSYAVKRLNSRRADSPLEAIKREMARSKVLRLSAPMPAPRGDDDPLDGVAVRQVAHDAGEPAEPDGEGQDELPLQEGATQRRRARGAA